jgi:hypothetical protein
MKALYRFICFWLLTTIPATAQLTFEFREQTFRKKSADEKVEVTFPFKNATDGVIEIKSVTSSCGCTTPALQKKSYKPGESGEIRATFKFGHRMGRQVKYITVAYGRPENVPNDRLKLEVTIVAPVLVRPRLVFWKRNSEPVTRKISLELDPDLDLENVEVSSSNADFRTELSETKDGHYELSVTPDTTTGKQSALIKIEASTADGQVKHTVSAYARVQ